MGKNIKTLSDHDNLEEKVWYGKDLLISKLLKDNAVMPKLTRFTLAAVTLISKGSISFRINHKTYLLEAPAIFTLAPNLVFEHIQHSDDLEGSCVAISDNIIQNLRLVSSYVTAELHDYHIFPNIPDAELTIYNQYLQLLFSLAHLKKTPINDFIIHNAIQSFFNYFLMLFFSSPENKKKFPRQSRAETISTEFYKLVDIFGTREHNITFYAEQIKLSPKYLSNILTRTSGHSPIYWIHRKILLEAKTMLFDNTKSFKQISDELHFASPSHFSAFFKKETGQTPTMYRESTQKSQE